MHDSGNANQIEGTDVTENTPLTGQGLVFNGTAYAPTNILLATDNTVLIRSESDLPDPVGGVITLVAGKVYVFVSLVDIANKLKPPSNANCQLTADTIYGGINYTGSGNLFENTSLETGRFTAFFMTIKTPSGTVYNLEGTTGFVVASYVFFEDCDSLGTVKGLPFTLFFNDFRDIGQGIIADSNRGFTYGRNFITGGKNQSGAVMITVRGSHNVIQIANNFPFTNGANESILNIEASSTITSASVTGNSIDTNAGGSIFAAGSKDQTAVGWGYVNNPGSPIGIPDSTVTAEAFFTGPATTTIIAQNAWMIANMSGVTSKGAERISVGADGILIYLGLNRDRIVLNGTTNMETDLGVNQNLEAEYVVISPTDTSCTFTNATNTINAVGHGRENGDVITFKNTAGTLPSELQDNIFYYVVNKADDTFQVSYTLGGAVVAFTDDGSGSNSYEVAEFVGEAGSATVGVNAPADFKPTSNSSALETNSEIVLAVRTKTTPLNDIVINSSYIRLNKI